MGSKFLSFAVFCRVFIEELVCGDHESAQAPAILEMKPADLNLVGQKIECIIAWHCR